MLSAKKKLWIVIGSAALALILAGVAVFIIVTNSGKKELTIAEAYKDYFKMGVALDVDPDNVQFLYDDAFVGQFSSLTAGNEMKWKYTENNKGQYTFRLGDYVVEKARSLGMVVRGHALVWHESTPAYVEQHAMNPDRSLAKQLVLDDIREHIYATVTHYGHDVVYCWDVVNEAISDSADPNQVYRTLTSDSKGSYLYDACGEDFIIEAFRAARQADPQIKLYYNDYNLNQPVKRAKAISLIKKLQAENLIDGIGEQAHYNIRNFDFEEFARMLDDFRALELDVQITELDFSVYESADEKFEYLTDELAALQAEAYAKVLEICRKNKDIIKGVTFWGGADDKTWLTNWGNNIRNDYPLLFDEFVERKPAYDAIMDFDRKFVVDKDKAEDEEYNVYGGNGDFHIGNGSWYGDFENGGFTLEYDFEKGGDTVTKVHYSKQEEYTEVISKITGDLQKFKYLNFTLSASKAVTMMAQLNYYIGVDDLNDKVLGEEPFDVDTQKKTYSIRIPDSRRLYLNLLDEVWLFPEPGEKDDINGRIMTGDFFIYDCWFSEESPSGAKVIEPSAAGSVVKEKAYKKAGFDTWYNETDWSHIKLNRNADGSMQMKASGADNWAFVSVQLTDFKMTDDKLKISFKDNDPNGSVSYIRFRLRATPKDVYNDGVNTYMRYYEKDLVDFVPDPAYKESYTKPAAGWPEEVEYDERTGVYTLYYNIGQEVEYLADHIDLSEEGYGLRLVILVETVAHSRETNTDYAENIKYPNNYSVEELRGQQVKGDKKFDVTFTEIDTYNGAEAEQDDGEDEGEN